MHQPHAHRSLPDCRSHADSEHPLAGAIVAGAKDRGLPQLPYSQFQAIAGEGVQAHV